MQRLKSIGLVKELEHDQAIVKMLVGMEKVGVKVDVAELQSLKKSLSNTKQLALQYFKDELGYYLNPSSPPQVEKLLYGKLKLKKPKSKPEQTSLTTSHDYIVKLKHPIVSRILEYREADKLEGAFVDRLLAMRDSTDRIHDDLSQIRTVSGRLTASIMILIPKKGEGGKQLRKCFVPGDGNVFLAADYSQIELRVLADQSQDERMLKVYREGGDIHAETAEGLFGIKPADQDPVLHRRPSKIVNFGIVYGFTPEGLLDELEPLGYDLAGCERLIARWFKTYPGAKEFMSKMYQNARRYGFVASPSGRRCLIPEVRSALPYIRNRGLRRAGNFPIQTHAAYIMKTAMAAIDKLEFDFYFETLIQTHDDLKFEVDLEHLTTVVPIIRSAMEGAGDLCIPTLVDMEYGFRWSAMEAVNELGI
jgi:DNA polymerase-1